MFEKLRAKFTLRQPTGEGVLERESDEAWFADVAEEIQQGRVRPGLWAKAIAEADGDDARARAIYIRLRVQSMKDEAYHQSVAEAEATAKARERQEGPNRQLVIAVADQHLLGARAALERGADPNCRMAGGEPVLYFTAGLGDPEMVELLLGAGAGPDQAYLGTTPLALASRLGHVEAARVLEEAVRVAAG